MFFCLVCNMSMKFFYPQLNCYTNDELLEWTCSNCALPPLVTTLASGPQWKQPQHLSVLGSGLATINIHINQSTNLFLIAASLFRLWQFDKQSGCICSSLKSLKFFEKPLKSYIYLQEKLAQNLWKRAKIAPNSWNP